MKFLVVSIFVLFEYSANAQYFEDREILGSWKAVNTYMREPDAVGFSKELEAKKREVKKVFKNSTFTFHKGGDFNIELTNTDSYLAEGLKSLDSTKWKFDPVNWRISIGTREDGYSMMHILFKKDRGVIFFLIEESGLGLEMKKLNN